MKARVCQLFEVCQHEFANFSLPCEGRLGVVPSASEQKFIEQNSPENHALCTEHNPGSKMVLVENTHGLMYLTQACRKNSGPCRKHARTKEYLIDLVENTSLQNPRSLTHASP